MYVLRMSCRINSLPILRSNYVHLLPHQNIRSTKALNKNRNKSKNKRENSRELFNGGAVEKSQNKLWWLLLWFQHKSLLSWPVSTCKWKICKCTHRFFVVVSCVSSFVHSLLLLRRVWALSSNSSRASSKCRRAATVRSSVPTIYDHVILTAAFCSFTTIMHREHTLSHTHTIIIMYGRVCDMVPHLFIQYKTTIFILYTYTLRNIEEGSTSWTFYQIFVVVVVTQFPCGSVVQGKPFNYTLGVFCIELKMDRTTI